jgi:dsRNA-specific ribonuclease
MQEDKNYSLIPLEKFKAVLGIDDRDDKLSRFCLVTATHTIEQYCKRRLLRKKHFERIEFIGELFLPLREYPISRVLVVYVLGNREWGNTRAGILSSDS